MMLRTAAGVIVALVAVLGCAPEGKGLKVEFVSGVVTLDGQPVSDASVQFLPVDASAGVEAAAGYTDEKGQYRLTSGNGDAEKGAQAGNYRVTISKIESKNLMEGQPYGTAPPPGKLSYKQTQLLNTVYQDREKSPFAVTVKQGKNTIDLPLKAQP